MVAVLAFAGIVDSLMQTLVIPIVPDLPRLLDAPASDTAWAVTATLLAAAVATSIGTSVASALAGVVLAQMTTDFGGFALPSENGFKVVMALGAGTALLAFLLASLIPRRRATAAAATSAGGSGELVEAGVQS
ncbi:hypothetical protein [Streptomyces adelaidensis]|uniref:hypothetical protein n=1 Tax=Streptomyces adelaidensis TaxID=2796465 RepID=UPI00227994FA|nr:hypothetical protein [Streptomyces adelaidensis]